MKVTASVIERDLGLSKIEKKLNLVDGSGLAVGVFHDAKDEEGTQVAEYAAANEFGVQSKNIPERSFMRSTFDENFQKYVDITGGDVEAMAENSIEAVRMLFDLGAEMTNDIKRKIKSNIPPANTPETKAAKRGGNKTLIDTGAMRNSIKFRIFKDKEQIK